jgi:hypothetical protein
MHWKYIGGFSFCMANNCGGVNSTYRNRWHCHVQSMTWDFFTKLSFILLKIPTISPIWKKFPFCPRYPPNTLPFQTESGTCRWSQSNRRHLTWAVASQSGTTCKSLHTSCFVPCMADTRIFFFFGF